MLLKERWTCGPTATRVKQPMMNNALQTTHNEQPTTHNPHYCDTANAIFSICAWFAAW